MAQTLSRRRLLKTSLIGASGTVLAVPAGRQSLIGRQPANTFTVETFEGGPDVEYEFTVSGTVEKGPAAGENDSITAQNGESRVTGEVGNGYADDFRVETRPTDWSANVASDRYRLLYNGSEIDPPRDGGQPENTFTVETFEGGPDVEYEFTVSGTVEKGPAAGENDSITAQNGESRVTGEVGNGYADDFRVEARPTDWSANVASDRYRLLYNGSEIDPPTGSDGQPDGDLSVDVSQIDAGSFPQIDAFVSVRDESDDPLPNLDADAFSLTEDGTSQTITSVTQVGSSSSTVNAVLLLDTSGSMEQRLADAKAGARAFVDTLQPSDRAAVVSYAGTVTTVQEFTSDRGRLDRAIGSLSAGGWTALFDGVEDAVSLAAGASGRTAVIVLADGENNRDPDGDGVGLDAVVDEATRANVSIFTIGLDTGAYDPDTLRTLATETGGRFFEAADAAALEGIYDAIGQTIAGEYRVRYTTSNDSRDGTERTVTVTASEGGGQGSDSGTYDAPGGATASICPTGIDVSPGETGSTTIRLRGIQNGFAGGEFLVTLPDVVRPTAVGANQRFGQTETDVSGREVRITVSDTDQNYQDTRTALDIGRIEVRGEREGSGTVSVDPIQADDDDGQSIGLSVSSGCGEITVSGGTCPTVDGTATTDPDGDGRCEDLNGNGRRDFDDVNTFFAEVDSDDVSRRSDAFDFNDDGTVDVVDVQALFHEQQGVR